MIRAGRSLDVRTKKPPVETPQLRAWVESVVEELISMLDDWDGDFDLEPEDDAGEEEQVR